MAQEMKFEIIDEHNGRPNLPFELDLSRSYLWDGIHHKFIARIPEEICVSNGIYLKFYEIETLVTTKELPLGHILGVL